MRELRFRAWHEKLGRMFDDVCVDSNGTELLDDTGKAWWIGHEHIMQFTGLFDRTGREIYEGDVLKLNIYNNVGKHSIRIVTFDRGCFGFIDTTGKFYPLGLIIGNKGDEKIFEVIGNIYENPEFLTSEKGE